MTLRQLAWRYDARLSADWDRTCTIQATLLNANRSKGQRVIRAAELHPMRDQIARRGGLPATPQRIEKIADMLDRRNAGL